MWRSAIPHLSAGSPPIAWFPQWAPRRLSWDPSRASGAAYSPADHARGREMVSPPVPRGDSIQPCRHSSQEVCRHNHKTSREACERYFALGGVLMVRNVPADATSSQDEKPPGPTLGEAARRGPGAGALDPRIGAKNGGPSTARARRTSYAIFLCPARLATESGTPTTSDAWRRHNSALFRKERTRNTLLNNDFQK